MQRNSLSLCLSLSLSPRNRARALATVHAASSITTLERQRESRRRVAGRLEDAADIALPVESGGDAHRVGLRRSWPTNGYGRTRRRRESNDQRTATTAAAEPYCGSCQARRVGAVTRRTVSRGSPRFGCTPCTLSVPFSPAEERGAARKRARNARDLQRARRDVARISRVSRRSRIYST